MGTKTETGFTIIETLLFLAITGLLAAAILVGSGVAIGQQRYRDSVNSLKSYIQQQYSEVTNVVNTRDKSWVCNTNGDIAESNPVAGEPRGTSGCVVLGRYITVDGTGTKLSSTNVIGYRTSGAAEATGDLAELIANYRLGISPIDPETTDVSWGSQIVRPKTTNPMPLSMLIIRSPLSGSLLTFTNEEVNASPKALLSASNMATARNLCMNASVGTFVGGRLAVRIDTFATNQSAIQIPPESENVCD